MGICYNEAVRLRLILTIGVLLLIIFWGVKLRNRQKYQYPPPESTFDEIGYVWLGQSLLRGGVPMDWTAHKFYFGPEVAGKAAAGLSSSGLIPPPGQSTRDLIYLDQEMSIDGYKSQFRLVQRALITRPHLI